MSSPIALVLMHLLAAQKLMTAESSSCPSGMTEIAGPVQSWCIQYFDIPVTFCDAVKTCHQNGQEMISKPVYDAMKSSSGLPGSGKWWVGLVDALNERGTQRDGWVWIKDGQVTNASVSDFDEVEPDNDGQSQDCMRVKIPSEKKLGDYDCDKLNYVYCYSDEAVAARVASKPSQGKFERTEIAEFVQPAPGCWIKEPKARTHEDCTLTCLQFEFGDCVGFYWHPVRRQCVLLPYFDASLPLDHSEFSANSAEMQQWRKYIKTFR